MTKEEMLELKEGDLVAMIRDGNDRTFFSKDFVYRVSRVVQDQVTLPCTPSHPSRDLADRVYAQTDFDVRSYHQHDLLSASLSFLPEDVRRVEARSERLQLVG